MKISLIRHGKSACDFSERITSEAYRKWVSQYNREGICDEAPQQVQAILQQAPLVLTSDLPRSLESAQQASTIQSDPIFRELELPFYNIRFLKIKPQMWTVFYRFLWFIGLSNQAETRKDARKRAKLASDILEECAKAKEPLVLVGHGFFNRFLGRELEKRRWKLQGDKSSANWACHTYWKD
ncbi:histidine phosphatase family protein [Anaerobacillus sp. 1_MG-2023]|uniref:phosphoglycerate mutase family protein n=1 Tax=Bacillales TaxID=1385 RepID=UPI0026E13973|nr:histidine phosphatase family protein [Anaerobacillus sp. 1_MG-2023]MDO6654270.1 histidine phosphatase family protein [Anaerobacillus sp. 1_MG-2023]